MPSGVRSPSSPHPRDGHPACAALPGPGAIPTRGRRIDPHRPARRRRRLHRGSAAATASLWRSGAHRVGRRGLRDDRGVEAVPHLRHRSAVLQGPGSRVPDRRADGGGMADDRRRWPPIGTVQRRPQRRTRRAGAARAASAPAHSTTNVQEAGVDEPDIVKTDGNRIVAVAQDRVHLIGSSGGKMTLRKTLPDTTARNVFLSGDRLLVFSGQRARDVRARPALGRSAGRSDHVRHLEPRAIRSSSPRLTIDGDVLDARLVGTQVRVATVSSPDVDAPSPVYTPDGRISPEVRRPSSGPLSRTRRSTTGSRRTPCGTERARR